MIKYFYILATLLFYNTQAIANIKMPDIFCDNMVLQQNAQIKLWGWGRALEVVKVITSWTTESYKDTVDYNGNWTIEIKTPSYGGPFEMTVEGYNKLQFNNIMIGEVWLVSGQSNMEWSINNGINKGEEEALKANHPNIRMFNTYTKSSATSESNALGKWEVCQPSTVRNFSAIGYFFARKLNQSLNIPIGIINSTWGGTPAEAWTPANAIEADPILIKNAEE
ncbi:MAG: hypothetical protein RLZZ546_1411 [Bacteroidota bacterium]